MLKEQEILDEFMKMVKDNESGTSFALEDLTNIVARKGYYKNIPAWINWFLKNKSTSNGIKVKRFDLEWLLRQVNEMSPFHAMEKEKLTTPEENLTTPSEESKAVAKKDQFLFENEVVKTQLEIIENNDFKGELINLFQPCFTKINEWETKADEIKVSDIKDTKLMKEAGTARKALVKVRTGAKEAVTQKKRKLKIESTALTKIFEEVENKIKPIEEKLRVQEEFKKRFEAEEAKKEEERKAALVSERMKILAPYGVDVSQYNLGDMDELVFDMLVKGAKSDKEKKDLEEKELLKAEELKREAEKAQVETQNSTPETQNSTPETQNSTPEKTVGQKTQEDLEKMHMLEFAKKLRGIGAPRYNYTDTGSRMVVKIILHLESLADGIEAVYG